MDPVRPRQAPRRPGPLRWLWYALTGRLAPAYRDWALNDLTCRTWPLRHLARLAVPLVPIAVALVLVLPGPMSVRVSAVGFGSVVGLLYSFVFLHDSTERRAVKLGFPAGTPERVRAHRREGGTLSAEAEDFMRRRDQR